MKGILLWSAVYVFSVSWVCAALPGDTSELLSPSQKEESTLSDAQTQGAATSTQSVAPTEPQVKDKIIYSSSNLTDTQKIIELGEKYGVKIYDAGGMSNEGLARTAREALEAFFPYAPPTLKVIELHAGAGEGSASPSYSDEGKNYYGTISVGVMMGDPGDPYSASLAAGVLPSHGFGDTAAEETLSTLFHEAAHVEVQGLHSNQFPHNMYLTYWDTCPSDYASVGLGGKYSQDEHEAEFVSLMFTRPDVMKAYCANYPSMKVLYDVTKKFFNDLNVPVPTTRLLPPEETSKGATAFNGRF